MAKHNWGILEHKLKRIPIGAIASVLWLTGADVITRVVGTFIGWTPGSYDPVRYWFSPLLVIFICFTVPVWAGYSTALYVVERWVKPFWLASLFRAAILAAGILVYRQLQGWENPPWNFEVLRWSMTVFVTLFTFGVKLRRFKPLD